MGKNTIMSSLDNLIERSTIRFPYLITGPEAELLFCYLRQEAKLITSYSLTEHKCVGNELQELREREAAVLLGYELSGRMFNPANHESSSFTAQHGFGGDGITYLSGIQFFTTPGKRIEEYRKEELALWDTAREFTQKYFQMRRPRPEDK